MVNTKQTQETIKKYDGQDHYWARPHKIQEYIDKGYAQTSNVQGVGEQALTLMVCEKPKVEQVISKQAETIEETVRQDEEKIAVTAERSDNKAGKKTKPKG